MKGPQISFDDEPSLPKLNNLATHVTECKKRGEAETTVVTEPSANLNLKRSADMMAAYLKRGELNPQVIPSQTGFLRLFAAFVLDESLPWTIGEAPSLHLLFKYLKISFTLPADSTVRNYLTKIYNELHGKVVHLFTARLYLLIMLISDIRVVGCEIQDSLYNRYLDYETNGLHILVHHGLLPHR